VPVTETPLGLFGVFSGNKTPTEAGMNLKKLALQKRVEAIKVQLSAAAINAGPGEVILPNKTFDELADVIEDLEKAVFE